MSVLKPIQNAHEFVSCDWGTSQFRLRLFDREQSKVLAEFQSEEGVARLASGREAEVRRAAFSACLNKNLRRLAEGVEKFPWGCPVIVSGMASSTIGWRELAYASVPFALDGSDLVWGEVEPSIVNDAPHRVLLLSGVRSANDIMRGEETQLLGLSSLAPGACFKQQAVVLLPGTHSKHVYVQGDKVVGFETYMTGEFFEVLSQHSVLRHSVAVEGHKVPQAPRLVVEALAAFEAAVGIGASEPLLRELFKVRTRQVLGGRPADENRAFLSGLLIGSEIGALPDNGGSGGPVLVCAGEGLAQLYEIACRALGLKDRLVVLTGPEMRLLTPMGQASFLNHFSPTS